MRCSSCSRALGDLTASFFAGTKVAGHRGFFLTGDGVDLNQAMITYGLDFLKKRGFKKVQPPFFMNKAVMAKTAQLEEFDEALYKVGSDLRSSEGERLTDCETTDRGRGRGQREVPHRDVRAAHLGHALGRVVRQAFGATPHQVRWVLDLLPQGGRFQRARRPRNLPHPPV